MTDYESLREEVRAQQEELRKRMRTIGDEFLTEQTKRVFAEYPELQGFSWTQYTPYFNDGDECVFSASTEYPSMKWAPVEERCPECGAVKAIEPPPAEDEEDDGWNPPGYEEFYSWYDKAKHNEHPRGRRWLEAGETIINILTAIDDDVYRDLFGDHRRVVVTREGIDVITIEHE